MSLFTKNTNKQNSQQQNQASQTQTSQAQNQPKEQNLLQTFSQCLPFLPLLVEQFTGQKIPPLQGTIAEIQASLSQIQFTQAQLLANQQEIARHVENLESHASQQFTNLQQQMQMVKLTHEKKEIEFNQPKPTQPEPSYQLKN